MDNSNCEAVSQQVIKHECCSDKRKLNLSYVKRIDTLNKRLEDKHRLIESIRREMSQLINEAEHKKQDLYRQERNEEAIIKKLRQQWWYSKNQCNCLKARVLLETQNIIKDLDEICNNVAEIRKAQYKLFIFSNIRTEINRVGARVKSLKAKILTFDK